jgi:hypothetical protein
MTAPASTEPGKSISKAALVAFSSLFGCLLAAFTALLSPPDRAMKELE